MKKRRIEYVRVSTGGSAAELKRQRRACGRFVRENGTHGIYVRAVSGEGDRIVIVPAGYGLSIFPVGAGATDLFAAFRGYELSLMAQRRRWALARRRNRR